MSKRNKNKQYIGKSNLRDCLTGQKLKQSQDPIAGVNAIDWAKKQGYIVIKPTMPEIIRDSEIALTTFISFLILALGRPL